MNAHAYSPQQQLLAVRRARCEQSLIHFVKSGWDQIEPLAFQANWHLDAIAEHLEAVANRQIKRLLINIPPRHGKSLIANVFFPAWIWAQNAGKDASGRKISVKEGAWRGPGVKFMHLSYAADLSSRDSVKCRRLIDSKWYQELWGERFAFAADQNQKLRFENNRGGHRISTSVGGKVTGDGGDCILFDDPHNVKDGESEVDRENVTRFWDESMPTRLNDAENGAFVVNMQRVHYKDLSGHILAKDMDWTHLCLPALGEVDHPHPVKTIVINTRTGKPWADDRAPGEPLWLDRFKLPVLENWAKEMGSYAAAGQLQQRPAPREGGIFKREWFEVVPAVPVTASIKVRAWDIAGTEEAVKSDPDYTAGLKMSRDPTTGFLYIENVVRFRETPAKVKERVKAIASADGRGVTIRIPLDPGAAGKFVVADFAAMLIGWPLRTEREDGSKEIRADPFAAQCEVGNVKLVAGPWVEDFLAELCSFPKGAHDDQVDAATAAFRRIADFANRPATIGRTTSFR